MRTPWHGPAMTTKRSLTLLTALALLGSSAPAAEAACARTSPKERWATAAVIFDGRALEGPTPTGVQRFRVVRYLKGHGPPVARVQTGIARNADGSGWGSGEGVHVRRGDRWRIFARRSATTGVLYTGTCDGSWRH